MPEEKTPYDLLMEYERSKRPRRATEPIKRSWIRPKRRQKKTLWRTGQVKEDAAGMASLRSRVYKRSGKVCECWRIPAHKKQCHGSQGCGKPVSWADGHMHHIIRRAVGSDTEANCVFLTSECHREVTGKPQWSRPVLPEYQATA